MSQRAIIPKFANIVPALVSMVLNVSLNQFCSIFVFQHKWPNNINICSYISTDSVKGSVDGLDISGDLKVKCDSNNSSSNKDSLVHCIPGQEDNNQSNTDSCKVFSKFGLDSINTNDTSEPVSVASLSSPTAVESPALPSSKRPIPSLLMSPTSCDSKAINPLASLASPSTYDSTKESHGTCSMNSEVLDTRSELSSSSPETANSLSTKQSTKTEGDSMFSGIATLGEDLDPEPANEEITRKIEMFREGLNRTMADQFTLADLYLMMGNPEKIMLEYDWVDIVDTPDILDLSHVTNMLRRLIHLASSEFTDFNKPKLPPQVLSLQCLLVITVSSVRSTRLLVND